MKITREIPKYAFTMGIEVTTAKLDWIKNTDNDSFKFNHSHLATSRVVPFVWFSTLW